MVVKKRKSKTTTKAKKRVVRKDKSNVKHWHWSNSQHKAVSHSHKGGDEMHTHFNRGWIHYGRTKRALMDNPELQLPEWDL